MNEITLPYSARSGTLTPAITSPAVATVGSKVILYMGDGFQEVAFDVTNFKYSPDLFVNGSFTEEQPVLVPLTPILTEPNTALR